MSLRNFLTNMSVDYAPYCLVGSSRGDVHGVSPGGHCGAVLVVRRLSLAPIASLRRHRRRRRRRLGACYRHENQYSTDCRTARGGAAGVATPHGARSPPDVPAAAAAAWTVGGADRSPRPAPPGLGPTRWVALPSIRLIPGPRRPARPGPARHGRAVANLLLRAARGCGARDQRRCAEPSEFRSVGVSAFARFSFIRRNDKVIVNIYTAQSLQHLYCTECAE